VEHSEYCFYETSQGVHMHRLILIALFLYSFTTAAHSAIEQEVQVTPEQQKELQAIKLVLETFRLSIIDKDKDRFIALFYAEDIPWLGVFSDTSLQFIQQKHPKIRQVAKDTYSNFIDGIVKNPQSIEEKFWNVTIQTDQYIASVHFDYSFHLGDYKSNWGQEAWQLIKTEQGWKINSVIWTMIANQQPPHQTTDKKVHE
jgi:hypothetical protein